MHVEATYIGTATILLRIGEVTLLTDPVFAPPGDTVSFGPGFRSKRLLGPAIEEADLPPVDAVLLSHDEHEDNLDARGRVLLGRAGKVVTTRAAQRRLGGNAVGLAPFETTEVTRGETTVRISATPARHGPPLSLPMVGHVVGFLLTWTGQRDGAIYVSGDTVLYDGIAEVAARGPIGAAFLHLGGAAWPTPAVRFTMNAREGARAAALLGAKRVFPVHADGWSHFRDDAAGIRPAFEAAGLADRLVSWKRGETFRWDA